MTYGYEDLWDEAFKALPDTQPLARLIRSDVQMPPAPRYRLAALLTPGNPPMWEWKFKCEENKAFKKVRRNVIIEDEYHRKMADGIRSEDAAEQAGSPHNIGDRQAYNVVKENTAEKVRARAARLAVIAMLGKIGGPIPADESPSKSTTQRKRRPRRPAR